MNAKKILLPLTDEIIAGLKAGDAVLLSGILFTGRDAAHKRIVEALARGEAPPFDIQGATIYYMGPSPAKPGAIIGAAGPTTSGRMDAYTPRLLQEGLKGMIGKGFRSEAVRQAIVEHHGVYFAAIGGIGALISKCVKKAEVIAYPELGAEAVLKLEVEDFPAIVINDIHGNDWYRIRK
ncbi:Fe-S-containing hydro-lyase [Patescibacteria group bacterium]|nr:Fe-S-containing hydro-lyase [Patescibacteria group bacterium]